MDTQTSDPYQLTRHIVDQFGEHDKTPLGQIRRILPYSDVRARARLQKVCRRAGVPYKGVHALRHYAGTRLMQQTGSLEHVARHLGHTQIETSRIYAKWSDETLREVLSEW